MTNKQVGGGGWVPLFVAVGVLCLHLSSLEAAAAGEPSRFFPGFQTFQIKTPDTIINGVVGGKGPPILLLHGFPQNHVEWRTVAPLLARDFTVVAADLRGYGDSGKPADGVNHAGYSKRETAKDLVEVMRQLGFDRFAVVGHDRGGRVAHRMALDCPDAVTRLAVLDIAPTHYLYTHVDKAFASAYYHWFFLIQPAPYPETLLQGNEAFFLRTQAFVSMIPDPVSPDVFSEYLRCFKDPATLHAMCEDYRAAASIDLEHDEADMNRKLASPVLALWGEKGVMGRQFDVLATWRERAVDVRGKAMPCGHLIPEQVPEQLVAELRPFLLAGPRIEAAFHKGIVPDGDLSDWKDIPFTSVTPATGVFDAEPARTDSSSDLSYRFAVCHDDEALYVAVEVTDDVIRVDGCAEGSVSCAAWDADAVEVFIDGNHNRAPDSRLPDGSELEYGGEFALVANGAANSDYSGYPKMFGRANTWQGATNWRAVKAGAKKVCYEFRITWAMMGGRVRSGDTVGFTLSVQDNDTGHRNHALSWCGNPRRPYVDERGFGDLVLRKE